MGRKKKEKTKTKIRYTVYEHGNLQCLHFLRVQLCPAPLSACACDGRVKYLAQGQSTPDHRVRRT
jgi:hypothetical protein